MAHHVFVWLAHPRTASFCGALADAYEAGARQAGGEVRRINLEDMTFNEAFSGYPDPRPLEPDLLAWQAGISWASHLAVIHPYWWGAMPARAKAVLDRALAPGFGFQYHNKGLGWDKLLSGRSADIIITSDTPPLYDRFVFHKTGRRVLKNQVLGFCGIKTRRVAQVGSVKTSSPEKRQQWVTTAQEMGQQAAKS